MDADDTTGLPAAPPAATGISGPPRTGRAVEPGWGDLLSGADAVRSLALAGGVALHAANVFVAATVLPSVAGDIGGLGWYAWSTTAFVVAGVLGATLSAGLLGRAGPRGAYALAAAVFAIGAIVCAAAPAMPVFLAGRAVQGLGGGALVALAYAMIRLVFREALWPRAMALEAAMWGLGTFAGPAVGGLFAGHGGWRGAFWCMAAAAAPFAALAAAALPGRGGGRDRLPAPPLPLARLALLAGAVLAASAGGVAPGPAWKAAGIAAAAALVCLLARSERIAGGRRLLPRGAFEPSGPLGAVYAAMSLLAAAAAAAAVFAPLFLQTLHGQPPLVAGYLGALVAAGWTLGSIASSGAGARGAGRAVLAAPVLALAGMAALALSMPRASGGGPSALAPACAGLLAVGLGVGLGWPHLLALVLRLAPVDEGHLASASLTTVQLLATAFGAALAGAVANAAGLAEPGGVAGASSAALWVFVVSAAVPALALPFAARVACLEPQERRRGELR